MTEDEVVRAIAAQTGSREEDISSSDKLFDLGADSLDIIEIIMELEERIGIEIGEDDELKFFMPAATVKDMIDLVNRLSAVH